MRLHHFLILSAVLLSLAACGSKYESRPIGIGRDPGEMKISPCACLLIKQEPGIPTELLG